MEEREIDLLDMLLNILLHWRGIIVLMVLGGVLLGAYSYVKSDRDVKAQIQQVEEQDTALADMDEDALKELKQTLEEAMTDTQIMNVQAVLSQERLYQQRMEYYERSILVHADADKVPEGHAIFIVNAEDAEAAKTIARIYEILMGSDGLYDRLSEKFDMDPSQVREVYSGISYSTDASDGTNSFRAGFLHPDADLCKSLLQETISYAKEQTASLRQTMGEHELVVLGPYFTEAINESVRNIQNSYQNDILNYETTIAKLKDAFVDEEKAYYDFLTKDMEAKNEEDIGNDAAADKDEDPVPDSAHVSLKYILVGIVLFAFLYVVILAVVYILDGRLKYNDDLPELYRISGLGKIPTSVKTTRPLQFVDNWLISLWNRNKRRFTAEEAVNLAAVAVKIAARQNELKTLSLVGCNMKEGTMAVCEQLKSLLEKEGVSVYIFDNILYDAETLEKLNSAEASVLVEKAGSTLYSEIEQELALLKRQNVPVLGGIIAE